MYAMSVYLQAEQSQVAGACGVSQADQQGALGADKAAATPFLFNFFVYT
jgi:hypothetical protein